MNHNIMAITQHIIKNYKTTEEDKEMLEVIKEEDELVHQMYDDAVKEEKKMDRIFI